MITYGSQNMPQCLINLSGEETEIVIVVAESASPKLAINTFILSVWLS